MTTRRILRLTGTDTRDFLQGLVTNDVTKLNDGLVYAALLTPQGKYLADFFLVPDGDAVLLDVATDLADGLVKRLSMYRLRADVQIEVTDLGVTRGTGPAPQSAFADPRHTDLGWRLYGSATGTDDSDWDAIRVAHCIPETGIELTADSYILEAGFERLNGVDFRKGCYVGQEVTARMKHKTELRKGLRQIRIQGDADVGTEILSEGKVAGTLFTHTDTVGIAYLRFDRARPGMTAGDARIDLPDA
ncbi:folate-binding protein [Aliisedimentitalea scapharcae]|uniref:Folate-binding protein n=1 Tax=Aliisedimentitalea scapharcae TaxID=1524259 RepID=A0ABZ2XNJ4_9RHOB